MTNERSALHQPFSRRRLLQGGAGLAAAGALSMFLPEAVRNAIASTPEIPFDVSQVKHIVLMMQENRSFDHYFGAMSGVRGFNDPNPTMLSTGKSVFYQPDPANPDGYLLPFHLDATTTSAQSLPSLSHAWAHQHGSWNEGAMDNFVRTHVAADSDTNGPYTMGYFEQADIPFHYALANNFTILDSYHCSIMGPTYPNRFMWMTGTVDPNGTNGGPALDNTVSFTSPSYTWTTTAEILQNHGVSWKCYQQLTAAATAQPTTPAELSSNLNNAGHNMFLYFPNVQSADQSTPFGLYQNAAYGSTLFGSEDGAGLGGLDTSITNPYTGRPFDYTTTFEEDCYNGTLPEVSWIVQPESVSEHPNYTPAAGAEYIASKVAAIAANPELWASTVFIINYDENDGLFDHVPPITPPTGTAEEFVHLRSPGGTPGDGYPLGSGFRVPCIIVSPWTVGGYVCSDPFEHTSTLRFIETVFLGGEPVNPNISAWRRETFGDLTSALQTGTGAPVSPAAPSAPADPNFTYATNETNLSTQKSNTSLPTPPLPLGNQTAPSQPSGSRPTPT
jgi:phospholipase C